MTAIKDNNNISQMPIVEPMSAVNKKDIYTAAEVQELQRELLQKQQQMEERMWADSTLSKFDDILRTNYDKSIEEFSDVVIYHVAKITNAMRGSFYTVGEGFVEATGCYACTLNSLFKTKFELGEGLVGQSVKSKEILYLENLPQQNLSVSSSSGLLSATSVIVVPLSFNDKVYGVIELLFLTTLEFKYKDLLSRLSRNVATMLQSIQSNAKTKALLNDSIFQAEALRSAEEELRQNMEEINTIREDIENKNKNLAEQVALTTELLNQSQQQAEMLQIREDELRKNLEELARTQEAMVVKQKEIDEIRHNEAERASKIAEMQKKATEKLALKLKLAQEELKNLKAIS
jgi:GAF domain-containing protein